MKSGHNCIYHLVSSRIPLGYAAKALKLTTWQNQEDSKKKNPPVRINVNANIM